MIRSLVLCLSLVSCPAFLQPTTAADLEIRRDLEFANVEGVPLHLDAYLQPAGTAPLLLFVHGGGFVSGDKQDYPHDLLDPITAAGFSAVSVNYRLAPRFPFPACTDDVEAAIAFVKAHAAEIRIDPDRIALLGPSAGGLIVSYVGAAARQANRVAAVVPMFGEHDLVLRVSEDPCAVDGHTIPRPPGGCISGGLAALLGFSEVQTDDHRRRLREASAVSHVHQGMPPYLLVHGTRDFGVPMEQSLSMRQAMLDAGADVTLIAIVGGGHGGWERLPQWATEKERIVSWLAEKTAAGRSSAR